MGGALPQDVPSYVTRASDDELYASLKAGEFCYVLNSRQMGKSSLMVRTLTRLQADGWAGVILDFSAKDSQSEKSRSDQADRWYAGIINQLNRELKLLDRLTFRQWLKERDFIAPVERLGEFIETVLLPSVDRPIVILIDEIDSTITLPFTDDFFALIRACYNKRAENLEYQRLTLALFGVAMPSELIGDAKRTPFNIGKAIDLKGFDLEEALPLATGLASNADRPPVALQEILHWTGGQPFLTQRVCQLVVDSAVPIAEGSEAALIKGLVRSRVIEQWESQDHQEHLKTIRQRLLDNEQKAGYWLELYRQVRQVGALSAQNRPEERELQLAGLVVKRQGRLQVYNPIYAAVFDDAWIDAELKKLRPYSESFRAWIASGKTDRSRLLRGEALAEAEQWAAERTPSAEDREFVSASRIQQQEEDIAAKEREAELAREKAAREAAEAAEQIQVEANRQAQRKIRRGSLVLGGALVAALVLGGLALGSVQQLAKSRAEQERIDQDLTQALDQFAVANEELAQSQEELKDVEAQRQDVYNQLKQTEQQAQEQQALLAKLKQDLANADAAVDQAKQAEQEAQRQAAQAVDDLQAARQDLEKVTQEQKEIVALNDKTKALSGLIDDLYAIDKPEAAKDAISHIGLSFTDFTGDNLELKRALLNSSIALAHLHLIPSDDANGGAQKRIKEAKTRIDESIQLIGDYPNLFNSSESASGRAIAFFTYAVQGNLREEQDYLQEEQAPTSASPSYAQAFRYTSESETPNFNSDTVASSLNQFRRSLSDESEGDQFRALATATLKKHYDFRARQLIRELEPVLAQHQWREADEPTWYAIVSSAFSRDLSFSYSIIACSSLRAMDNLWSEHSAGRFGLNVQKDIFEQTGNAAGIYNGTAWSRFTQQVGWSRIVDRRIYLLSNYELSWPDGVSGDNLTAPPGHLPFLSGELDWVVRGHLFSRIASCNP